MSPALLACYPKFNWQKAVKAAKALAIEQKLSEANFEALYLDQHRSCECARCGHKHSVTKRRGVYFNGRLVHELVEKADAEVHRQQLRLALGL